MAIDIIIFMHAGYISIWFLRTNILFLCHIGLSASTAEAVRDSVFPIWSYDALLQRSNSTSARHRSLFMHSLHFTGCRRLLNMDNEAAEVLEVYQK